MTNKKTFFALLLAAMMCVPFTTSAQVTIGSDRAPSEWSLLDLCTQAQQKALHNARMDEVQRDLLMSPAHPEAEQLVARGLLIFRTDAIEIRPNEYVGCLEFWNGVTWVSLCHNRVIQMSQPPLIGRDVCTGVPHYPNCVILLGLPYIVSTGELITDASFQWQHLNDNGVWQNIAVATGQNLTMPNITVATSFRRIAVWNNLRDTTNVGVMTIPPAAHYTAPTFVQLGNVRWATHNVDFETESGFTLAPSYSGMFFQFGRRYGWEGTTYNTTVPPTRRWDPELGVGNLGGWTTGISWNPNLVPGTPNGASGAHLREWPVGSDPCRFIGDGNWRLPNNTDINNLLTAEWRAVPAIEAAGLGLGCQPGHMFGTAENPNQVFFPHFGVRVNTTGVRSGMNQNGNFASSTVHGGGSDASTYTIRMIMPHSTGDVSRGTAPRANGLNVRCVRCNAPSNVIPHPPMPASLTLTVIRGQGTWIRPGSAVGCSDNLFEYRWERSTTLVGQPIVGWEPAMGDDGIRWTTTHAEDLMVGINTYYRVHNRYIRRVAIWNRNTEFPGTPIAITVVTP